MALSYYEYTADGENINYPCKRYLQPEHLVITIDGEVQPSSAYTIDKTIVTFNSTPPRGAKVRIGRSSNQDERLTDYRDASLLTADTMDADAFQLFYICLLYTSPSPRDRQKSRMPSSA